MGLYFYGARWYDPLLGRFTQADTIIPAPAAPQALNRYAYTLNNPLRYTDPSGHAYWGGDDYDPADEWNAPSRSRIWWIKAKVWWRKTKNIALDFVPIVGSARQIKRGWNMAQSAAQSPDFANQQLAYQEWSAMNCPGVCHRSPEVTEAAYGEDAWRWRNQPRPDTPLVDAYSAGVGGVVSGGMSLAFETLAFGQAVQQFTPSQTLTPNEIGRLGEEAAGITGPKTRIPSLTGTANYRIPDQIDDINEILREVKNVSKLSYTNQLRDFTAWTKQNGYTFELVVRQDTTLSGPLQTAIDSGDITLRYLPW